MSKTDDGGPAFPTPELVNANRDIMVMASPGMSLRDWFAGQALAGLALDDYAPIDAAQYAYRIADAMLAARATGQAGEG